MARIRWTANVEFRDEKGTPLKDQSCESVKAFVDYGRKIQMKAFVIKKREETSGFDEVVYYFEHGEDPYVRSVEWNSTVIKSMEKKDGYWEAITKSGTIYRIIGD